MIVFVNREDGKIKFLTKGDNNNVDDRGLYAPGQYWLERKDLIGKAKGYFCLICVIDIFKINFFLDLFRILVL
jgi:signal peptidase